MRFEFDDNGYVCCVLYGCTTGSCVEYAGLVPSEPEEYTDMDDWANRAQIQAYYLDDQGNLVFDAERAVSLPDEGDIVLRPYTEKELEALGIKQAIITEISDNVLLYWPVGSVYLRSDNTDPSYIFGGNWTQIESGISGIYAFKRTE